MLTLVSPAHASEELVVIPRSQIVEAIAHYEKLDADLTAVKAQLELALKRLDMMEQLLTNQQLQIDQLSKMLELKEREIVLKDKQIADLKADSERLYERIQAEEKWQTLKMIGVAGLTVLSIVLLHGVVF